MHPALFLDEILHIIFTHRHDERFYFLPGDRPLVDLVSLATTCRAFKEPALDVLWTNVYNLAQLVRCLPAFPVKVLLRDGKRIYALERDLEPTEVDTVKAYARRVRVLVISSDHIQPHLHPDTLEHLCRTSQTEPLCPNLRELDLTVLNDVVPLSHHLGVPNLRDLTLSIISTSTPSSCEGFMRSLSSGSLAIQDVSIRFREGCSSAAFSDIVNQHIRRWTRLRSMDCPDMSMDFDTFLHLSRLPSLTRLSFALNSALIDQIEASNYPLVLPALEFMTLYITSMVSNFKFLIHMRFPALKGIFMNYNKSLPRDVIRSFEIALQTACNHELTTITLDGSASWSPRGAEPRAMLVLDDILPFAAFNLIHIRVELDWIVDLKDVDLLRLASDCPRIESLCINSKFGWRSAGITPIGLQKVLRLCPSLWVICIALDTRGYKVLPRRELESEYLINDGLSDSLPSDRHIWLLHLTDSVIEAESVPALAGFFADYMPSNAVFMSWASDTVKSLHNNWHVYEMRWGDVQTMAEEMRSKRLCIRGEE